MRGGCAQIIRWKRIINVQHVDNTLGYTPWESLSGTHFSHSRDVWTPRCAHCRPWSGRKE